MTDALKTVPPEVIEALKRGDKQAAMKMLLAGQKVTGIGDVMKLLKALQESGVLKEVKQQVNVNISTARSDALPAGVVDAIRKGNKIEAIKLLREATGVGLYEARGTVDSFEAANRMAAGQPVEAQTDIKALIPTAAPAREHAAKSSAAPASAPATQPGLSPGEVPRTGGKAIGFVIVLVIAAILVFFALK
jgi:ribosomal protein L7/L12